MGVWGYGGMGVWGYGGMGVWGYGGVLYQYLWFKKGGIIITIILIKISILRYHDEYNAILLWVNTGGGSSVL